MSNKGKKVDHNAQLCLLFIVAVRKQALGTKLNNSIHNFKVRGDTFVSIYPGGRVGEWRGWDAGFETLRARFPNARW